MKTDTALKFGGLRLLGRKNPFFEQNLLCINENLAIFIQTKLKLKNNFVQG